eukprot:5473243-Alexandrium_andersonii.AAC.1
MGEVRNPWITLVITYLPVQATSRLRSCLLRQLWNFGVACSSNSGNSEISCSSNSAKAPPTQNPPLGSSAERF